MVCCCLSGHPGFVNGAIVVLNAVIVHTAVSPLSWEQTRDWLVALSRSSLKEPETFTPTTSFILKAMTSSAAWELVSGSNFDNIFKLRFISECLPQVNVARTLARRCRVETEAVVNRFQTLLTSTAVTARLASQVRLVVERTAFILQLFVTRAR